MTQLLLSYCWQQFAKQLTNNVGANSVRPFSSPTWFMETQTSQLPEAGRRGRRPLQLRYDLPCRKIAVALCGFTLHYGREKSGAEFLLRHRFVLFFTFICFFAFFCTACRLSPIEALPQALTGLCPVPTRGFTPWPWPGACPWTFCSLRSVLNFTSCLVFTLVSYAHSSLLTPHSSLITLT